MEIRYLDEEDEEVEAITLVAPMDERAQKGWVSCTTPLAMAIENKGIGDVAHYEVKGKGETRGVKMSVKIVSIA